MVFVWFVALALFISSDGKEEFKADLQDCSDRQCETKNGKVYDLDVCDIKTFNCTDCEDGRCVFFRYGARKESLYLHLFNLFGLLWGWGFINAMSELILAGAFSQWYFVLDKSALPYFMIVRSFVRTLRYHVGTAAVGSLILAIIQSIRIALEYVDRKLKEQNQSSPVVKVLMTCCKGCFWMLEK